MPDVLTLGQSVLLAYYVTDANGNGVSPTTATLTITLPDGTTVTPTVTEDGTTVGLFELDYVPATVGAYSAVFVTTGPAGADATAWLVQTGDTLPVDLSELRRHLNWSTTKDASEDDRLLDTAVEALSILESEMSRPLVKRTYTLRYVHGVTDPVLPHVPCHCETCEPYATLAVSTDNGDAVTATPAGVLSGLTSDATITYTAGCQPVPPWAKIAIKRMTEHLWARTAAPRMTRDRASAESQPSTPAFLLPYMVQSLIKPHRLVGG
jgi:hypothetical protein